ncbi:MAG: hypothetical protein C0483_16520 [Pirellula sp.]|nr:hypothetical protein [Pirellula sp.]
MLVLSRKVEQQIQIGEGIVITILQVKGNQVRIGIDAPRNVRVLRGELEPKAEEQVASHSEVSEHELKATDDRVFTIIRRNNEFATAERSRPNESPKAEATSTDLQLRLSRRSSMNALRGFVLPRR